MRAETVLDIFKALPASEKDRFRLLLLQQQESQQQQTTKARKAKEADDDLNAFFDSVILGSRQHKNNS